MRSEEQPNFFQAVAEGLIFVGSIAAVYFIYEIAVFFKGLFL